MVVVLSSVAMALLFGAAPKAEDLRELPASDDAMVATSSIATSSIATPSIATSSVATSSIATSSIAMSLVGLDQPPPSSSAPNPPPSSSAPNPPPSSSAPNPPPPSSAPNPPPATPGTPTSPTPADPSQEPTTTPPGPAAPAVHPAAPPTTSSPSELPPGTVPPETAPTPEPSAPPPTPETAPAPTSADASVRPEATVPPEGSATTDASVVREHPHGHHHHEGHTCRHCSHHRGHKRHDRIEKSFDVSPRIGYAVGSARHPEYLEQFVHGVAFTLDLSAAITRKWSLGVFASHMEMPIRESGEDRYVRDGSVPNSFRVPCESCSPPAGGKIISHMMITLLAGARIEYRPIGFNGPYIQVGSGAGLVDFERSEVGGGFALGLGYRHFIFDQMSVGTGIEAQSLLSSGGETWLGLWTFELRLRFPKNYVEPSIDRAAR